MPRTVTLVLANGEGDLLGALPPLVVESDYWQQMDDVVRAAHDRFGVSVQVLRLLTTQHPRPHGGAISYLAELEQSQPTRPTGPTGPTGLGGLEPVDPSAVLPAESDEPLRPAFARPGGPAASIAWARASLGPVAAGQQRTWNLSAIWRLGGARRKFWLKQLPAFYPHEPVALSWLNQAVPDLAPRLLAVGPQGRELLADVPGPDLYQADLRGRLQITEQAHRFQLAARPAVEHLLAQGLPDRRGAAMTGWIRTCLADWLQDRPGVVELLGGLAERMAAVTDCAVPDTLVHGDAHPGNVRGDGDRIAFLDWSDCFVGHPTFDVLELVDGLPAPQQQVILDAWAAGWQRDVPGCSPLRAVELLRPVSYLRAAAVYAEFVANIEPTERRYHSFDVPDMLDAALTADRTD